VALDHAAKALLTPQQRLRQLAFWIEGYYNSERRHSKIGYLSPIDYVQQYGLRLTACKSTPVHSHR
jgi:transposase InsO family protein